VASSRDDTKHLNHAEAKKNRKRRDPLSLATTARSVGHASS